MAQNSINNTFLGVGAEDAFNIYRNATPQTYSHGIDTSDADSLKITDGASPSLGTVLSRMSTAGERTLPLQPVFFAFLSATDNNVTGAGTSFTFGTGNALTVTQQGTSMATNGTFTAPITGWYLFSSTIIFDGLGALNTNSNCIFFVNGATVYFGTGINPGVVRDPSNGLVQPFTNIISLSAGDTVVVAANVNGGAGDTVDIRGGGINTSTFSGALLF